MEQIIINKVLSQIQHGTLHLEYWDGKKQKFGKGKPEVYVTIKKRSVVRKAIRQPSLVFGEAYVDGDITISTPLAELVKFIELNPLNLEIGTKLGSLRRKKKNVKSRQAKFVAHHYDIGNDFYKLWLDSTMNYSCAYFKTPKDSLEAAQKQKTEHLLRKLQLRRGLRVLDIGSGWGYLLVTAAKKYKIQGLGVSLSKEQVKFAQELARREKVDHLVKFKYLNYQDVPPKQKFDRIISVGFFEHVGQSNIAKYFDVVDRHLVDDGISVLHSISHKNESPTDPWIDKYIFPGGYLPSVRETVSLMADHDFYLFDYENLGQHYGMTIEKWHENFRKHRKAVVEMYDEKFYRMWELYLLAAMNTFKTGSSGLSQFVFKKGKNPSWPLTREFLYK